MAKSKHRGKEERHLCPWNKTQQNHLRNSFLNSSHRAFSHNWASHPLIRRSLCKVQSFPCSLQGLLIFLVEPLVIMAINITYMLLNTREAKSLLGLITQQQVLNLFPSLTLRTLSKEFTTGPTEADAAWVIAMIWEPSGTTPAINDRSSITLLQKINVSPWHSQTNGLLPQNLKITIHILALCISQADYDKNGNWNKTQSFKGCSHQFPPHSRPDLTSPGISLLIRQVGSSGLGGAGVPASDKESGVENKYCKILQGQSRIEKTLIKWD